MEPQSSITYSVNYIPWGSGTQMHLVAQVSHSVGGDGLGGWKLKEGGGIIQQGNPLDYSVDLTSVKKWRGVGMGMQDVAGRSQTLMQIWWTIGQFDWVPQSKDCPLDMSLAELKELPSSTPTACRREVSDEGAEAGNSQLTGHLATLNLDVTVNDLKVGQSDFKVHFFYTRLLKFTGPPVTYPKI